MKAGRDKTRFYDADEARTPKEPPPVVKNHGPVLFTSPLPKESPPVSVVADNHSRRLLSVCMDIRKK